MNETNDIFEDELTHKTAIAALLRAFQAEYDWKITTDRRDLWNSKLSHVDPHVILKTLDYWIKNENKSN